MRAPRISHYYLVAIVAVLLGCAPSRADLLRAIAANQAAIGQVQTEVVAVGAQVVEIEDRADSREQASRLLVEQANEATRRLIGSTGDLVDRVASIEQVVELLGGENKHVKQMLEAERQRAKRELSERDAEISSLRERIDTLTKANYGDELAEGDGWISFRAGSFVLEDHARELLAEIARAVGERRDFRFELDVHGYASPDGDERENQRLALLRAGAVKDYLVECGLDGALIWIDGKGTAIPPGVDPEDKTRRRTVWIFVRSAVKTGPP